MNFITSVPDRQMPTHDLTQLEINHRKHDSKCYDAKKTGQLKPENN